MDLGPGIGRAARRVAAALAAALLLSGVVLLVNYLLGGPYASIREPAWSISLVVAALVLAVALGISWVWRQRHDQLLRLQLAAERERIALAERVAHLMKGANDAILLTDENFRIIEANDRALETYGYTLAELQQKQMVELRAPHHRTTFPQLAERLAAERRVFFESVHQRKNGATFPVEVSVRLAEIGGASYTLGIVRDITERKEAEARQRLALDALELLNRAGNVSSLGSELLQLIKNSTGFDAVGLRLREGDDFPYYEQSGFSDAFVQAEKSLCAKGMDGYIMRDAAGRPVLECTCGAVLSGRADISMPWFTKGGSFWTNASSELLALAPKDDPRVKPRNRCIDAGYESIALIPLRSGDEIIGLLQLNDRREGRLTPGLVGFFEGLGASIGIALKHKQAEEAVAESERRYRQTVEASLDAIAIHRDGKILFVNSAAVSLARAKTVDDLLGRPILDVVHPDDREKASQRVRVTLDTGTAAPLTEERLVRLDGTVFDAEIRAHPVVYLGQHAIQVLIRDVTERKRAEEALRQSEDRYRDLVEHSQELICTHDLEGRILSANPWSSRVLGYQLDTILQMNIRDFLVPEVRGQVDTYLAEIKKHGAAKGLLLVQTAAGERRIWEYNNTLRTEGVAAAIVRGTARDITERKRVEAEQAALLEIAKDIAGVVDLSDLLKRVHQRTAAVLPCDYVVTYYFHATREAYRALAWHGVPSRLEADMTALEFPSGHPLVEAARGITTVVINDISDQSLVPPEIFARFGLSAVIVAPFGVQGRRMGALVALNAEIGRRFAPHQVRLLEGIAQQVGVAIEAAELSRAKEEEAAIAGAFARVGQEIISSLSSPALLHRLCELTIEMLGCDRSSTWLWDTRQDAFVPVASYGAAPEQWEIVRLVKFGRPALATQIEGMERDGFFQMKTADLPDSEVKAVARVCGMTASMMVPLRRGGELLGFHTADYCGREEVMSERHRRIMRGIGQLASLALENVRLIEELERANRLKSDFVATISHELRTPLNIIMGYNDLLLDGGFGPMSAEQVDTLQRVGKSAEDLLELITATLDLSRLDTGQVQLDVRTIALPDLVGELDAEISGLRENSNVRFAWDVAADLPALRSDPVKLKVVLKNLIGNAIKFTHAGSVVVRLCGRDGGLEITVADTGVGIAREMLPVIFEPFRQGEPAMTRQHGGVGLGLYIVRRVLDVLGGTIDAESTVGQGSTFRVWVPSQVPA
jgi:PAS domain S-box-containing protein